MPTIKKLGITNPRELDTRWVSCRFVPTGRSYADKNTGEMKQATTFSFIALYDSELACRQAYQAANPARANAAAADPTFAAQPQPYTSQAAVAVPAPVSTAQQMSAPDNPERAVAWKFAQIFMAQTAGDINALAQKLASNPVVAKYFSINSPEVVNVLMGQAVSA